jgi:hypothetical protein
VTVEGGGGGAAGTEECDSEQAGWKQLNMHPWGLTTLLLAW